MKIKLIWNVSQEKIIIDTDNKTIKRCYKNGNSQEGELIVGENMIGDIYIYGRNEDLNCKHFTPTYFINDLIHIDLDKEKMLEFKKEIKNIKGEGQ